MKVDITTGYFVLKCTKKKPWKVILAYLFHGPESENLSDLNDPNKDDNITGLNDINSLCGLKKLKTACTYTEIFPGIWNSAASINKKQKKLTQARK